MTPDGARAPQAGLVCWRPGRDAGQGGFDVLVTRPDPDAGWSLPTAPVGEGETAPQAAWRSLAEAPGGGLRLVPRLGLPLPGPADSRFWAARLRVREPFADEGGREYTWVAATDCGAVLTEDDARRAVDAAASAHAEQRLHTRPLLVVRHAKARPRSRWSHADAERPLVDLGRRQAAALAGLLECWHPELLVTSPWKRCVDTLLPYVDATGLRLKTRGGLTEQTHRSRPQRARRQVRAALERTEPALLCTHRPVLATVLPRLEEHCAEAARAVVPQEDPFLAPSEALVAHVVRSRPSSKPTVLAVELHRPVL